MTPSARMRARRQQLGLSYRALGRACFLSAGHLFQLEHGKTPMERLAYENACLLASALGMSLSRLMSQDAPSEHEQGHRAPAGEAVNEQDYPHRRTP